MDDLKKIGIPALFIWISAFLINVIKTYLSFSATDFLVSLGTVLSFFLFGALLNKNRKRKSKSVTKKVIAILLFLFIYMIHYGYIQQTIFDQILLIFGMKNVFIYMLYILCGYMFVD